MQRSAFHCPFDPQTASYSLLNNYLTPTKILTYLLIPFHFRAFDIELIPDFPFVNNPFTSNNNNQNHN